MLDWKRSMQWQNIGRCVGASRPQPSTAAAPPRKSRSHIIGPYPLACFSSGNFIYHVRLLRKTEVAQVLNAVGSDSPGSSRDVLVEVDAGMFLQWHPIGTTSLSPMEISSPDRELPRRRVLATPSAASYSSTRTWSSPMSRMVPTATTST